MSEVDDEIGMMLLRPGMKYSCIGKLRHDLMIECESEDDAIILMENTELQRGHCEGAPMNIDSARIAVRIGVGVAVAAFVVAGMVLVMLAVIEGLRWLG